MIKQLRLFFPSITLLLVLLVSLMRPMAVYADDTSPPPPATEEPAAPPTEEAPTEAPSEPAPTETTDAAAAPTVEEEVAVVAEVLEAAPEGTEVVVLNESSETVPLTSEEAAAIVAVADPMWCPAGVLPGGAGCTTNFASPQALIDDMDLQNPATTNSVYEQDGIIYFTANPGGAFVLVPGTGLALSTSDYNAVKNYNLTLQGGWNGSSGAGFALGGQTDFGANHVQIGTVANPWIGNITINNISIDGVTGGANNTLNTGLVVFTAGAINLNEVHSQNNAASGALLDNSSGDKDVTVQNSSVNNNTQNGLRVASKGNITLNGFLAQGNNTRGALLDNSTGTGGISSNSSNFSGNGTLGLDALSNGNISLFDVIANENGDTGALLDNCFVDEIAGVCTSTGTGSITINGSSAGSTSFSGNSVNGIEAYSNGDITVNNAAVNGNAEYGASLINDLGEANVFVSNSTFNSNTSTGQDVGLEVFSGGDITLTNVSANNNLAGTGSFLSGSSLLVEHSFFNGNASANPEAGQGMFAEAEEAEMVCSQFSGNGTYGLDASLVLLLTLDDVIFGGNGSGDYLGSAFVTTGGCSLDEGGEEGGDEGGEEGGDEEGGEDEGEDEGEEESSGSENQALDIVPVTGLPLNIVSVLGGEQTELNCEAFSGTKLILPNGDSVILPCPIHDQGSLVGHTQDQLPGELDEQFGFLSALNAGVIRDGQSLSTVEPSLVVKFVIPEGQDSANLAILHWDGSQWVEFPSQVSSDGSFDTTTNFTGVFVLVTK